MPFLAKSVQISPNLGGKLQKRPRAVRAVGPGSILLIFAVYKDPLAKVRTWSKCHFASLSGGERTPASIISYLAP